MKYFRKKGKQPIGQQQCKHLVTYLIHQAKELGTVTREHLVQE